MFFNNSYIDNCPGQWKWGRGREAGEISFYDQLGYIIGYGDLTTFWNMSWFAEFVS